MEANEARLAQLFLCLLINAAHAIPEGQADRHEVRVTTKTDVRNNAVVEVSDTGRGIAPENLSRVFDPFFTTEPQNGSGLGLAISHGTVKSLGGEIAVASEPGRGTTFRVVLRPAQRWAASTPPGRDGGPPTRRRRVLVIDDDRLIGESIASALSETHDVEIVTEVCRALDRITAGKRYDVVVCELMMPVMTGMDLYATIVPRDPKLAGRFVFTTTGAFTPRARAFLESVSNPCLPKPIAMGPLRSMIARVNGLSASDGALPPGWAAADARAIPFL